MSAASLTATARRLLAKNGQPVVFRYVEPGSVNPATGRGTLGAPVAVSGNGYPSRYKSDDVDGTNVLRTDTRLIVEKVAEAPQKGWDCEINDITFRVMDVQLVSLAGQAVIYICQLRSD